MVGKLSIAKLILKSVYEGYVSKSAWLCISCSHHNVSLHNKRGFLIINGCDKVKRYQLLVHAIVQIMIQKQIE